MNKQPLKSASSFSHLDAEGRARMVDVGGKRATRRTAVAEAWVELGDRLVGKLRSGAALRKGNVLETARLAGILAAKKTAELVPMCHPLPLDSVEIEAEWEGSRVRLLATVSARAPTGVEMEAITAVSIAAVTIYDMVKSEGKGIPIGPIWLLEKRGGKSGYWKREEPVHGTR
jgi:cyclic pyranopterin phosphate synthase